MMKVTVLNGLFKTHKENVELPTILGWIKNGKYTQQVIQCRATLGKLGKAAYKKKKVNLPCFTPSGRFKQAWKSDDKTGQKKPATPRKDHLIEYNGNVVLDYDDLDVFQLQEITQKARSAPYTHTCFESPSGDGFKIIVKTTNQDPLQHANAFKAVSDYYNKLCGLEAKSDTSSSNFNRLCFVSSDAALMYNKDSKVFAFQASLFKPKKTKQAPAPTPIEIDNVEEYIVKAMNLVESKGYLFVDGKRREYIKYFTIECVKFGVPINECKTFVENNLLSADCDHKMVNDLVEGMYKFISANEHGIYAKWTAENRPKSKQSTAPKEKEYKPELYQEKEVEAAKIELPVLSYDEISNLEDDKLRKSIIYQNLIEKKLNEFFEFRVNILKDREEYRMKGSQKFKEVTQREYNQMSRAFIKHGVNCPPSKLQTVISSHFAKDVNPVKEMFQRWSKNLGDDKTDYIKKVAQLVKTDAPKGLFETVFKKWLVASVANVFVENQCTNHHCIVLCGRQGTNKTTFFTSLFSSEYTFTGHMDLRNKDSMILLADTFLIVLDEQFSVLDKDQDWEILKSSITMPRVKARWHYAKNSRLRPRIANFCGTANRIDILQDDTGNRRFIPFQLTDVIDLNKLRKIDMSKLWAQAYNLYKSGWYYLSSRKEQQQIELYQKDFKKLNDEHHFIMDMYEPSDFDDTTLDAEYLSSGEVLKDINDTYGKGQLKVNAVGRALSFLGFEQKTFVRDKDSKRGRYWAIKRI